MSEIEYRAPSENPQGVLCIVISNANISDGTSDRKMTEVKNCAASGSRKSPMKFATFHIFPELLGELEATMVVVEVMSGHKRERLRMIVRTLVINHVKCHHHGCDH